MKHSCFLLLSTVLLLNGCNSTDEPGSENDLDALSGQRLCDQAVRLTGVRLQPTLHQDNNIGVEIELVDGYYPVAQSEITFNQHALSVGESGDNCVPRAENPVRFDAWQLFFDTPVSVGGKTVPANTNLKDMQLFDGFFYNIHLNPLSPSALGQVILDKTVVLPQGEHQMTLIWTTEQGEQLSDTVPLRVN